jgi:hypothetical protein
LEIVTVPIASAPGRAYGPVAEAEGEPLSEEQPGSRSAPVPIALAHRSWRRES